MTPIGGKRQFPVPVGCGHGTNSQHGWLEPQEVGVSQHIEYILGEWRKEIGEEGDDGPTMVHDLRRQLDNNPATGAARPLAMFQTLEPTRSDV